MTRNYAGVDDDLHLIITVMFHPTSSKALAVRLEVPVKSTQRTYRMHIYRCVEVRVGIIVVVL